MRTNYCRNPSFETGTLKWGWVKSSGMTGTPVATQVTDPAFGSYSVDIAYTANADDSASYLDYLMTNTGASTAASGDYWTVSFYLKLGASSNGTFSTTLRICEYNSSGTYLTTHSSSDIWSSLTTSYQRFNYTGLLTQATCDRVAGYLHVAGIANGEVMNFRLDAALLEKTGTLGDYFDGSMTDGGGWVYDWTGTAHDSFSTATESVAAPVLVAEQSGDDILVSWS